MTSKQRTTLDRILLSIGVVVVVCLLGIVIGMITDNPAHALLVVLPGAVLLIILAVVSSASASAARGRRAWAILSTLEQAVRLNLPLPRIVRAIGESEPGRVGQQMLSSADAIDRGEPLAELIRTIPQIPQRVVLATAAAERTGHLPQVLARLIEQRRAAISQRLELGSFYRVYPLILVTAFFGIASMLVVFVIPKFESVCRDFKIPLPLPTRLLISAAGSGGSLILIIPALGIVGLLYMALSWRWVGPSAGFVQTPGQWMLDRLPLIGTARLHRALGDVLEFTADSVETGRPLPDSLTEAASIVINTRLRRMVLRWTDQMRHGQSIANAARLAGLPPLVCGMLSTAIHASDLSPILRFLGRYYTTRFSRTLMLLQAAIIPVISIFMGILVAWLGLSIVLPLTRMVNSAAWYSSKL